ncbi:glycosyltransferase family 4 protein [Bacillus sp. EB600]|nr:glycosyltransferase family 4 protein [Bacillus sp. EB600]
MYIDQLKRGLEKKGHHVDILAKHPNLNGYYLVNHGKFISCDKLNKLINSCFNGYLSARVPIAKEKSNHCFELAASYFNLEDYDIIHTQDIFSTRLLSRVKPKNTPLIASIHGCIATEYLIHRDRSFIYNNHIPNSNHHFDWKYKYWQEYSGATSSDITIVATNWLNNLLINGFNVPPQQLTIIPYGQDISEFDKKMEETSPVISPPGKTVIVCPARLAFIKGHKILIQTLEKLKQQRNDWVCWLVGDGNLRNELKLMTKRLNLEQNVKFLGVQKNIPAILKQADICVLSSLQESFPYAIMEAQLAGLPVVVSDAGGLPETVVNGQTGFISQKGNSDSIYMNIRQLMENKEMRNAMAANARLWAIQKWDLETMVDRTLDIYEQVIKSKKGGDA